MPILTRPPAFSVLPAAVLDEYADEIERAIAGIFSDNTKTAAPLFRVRRTSTQSLPNATDTLVSWQTADKDPDGMWNPASPTIITFNTAGVWIVMTQLRYAGGTNGTSRTNKLWLGGSSDTFAVAETQGQPRVFGASPQTLMLAQIPAGQPLRTVAFQDNGGPLNLDITFGGTYAAGAWLGPI